MQFPCVAGILCTGEVSSGRHGRVVAAIICQDFMETNDTHADNIDARHKCLIPSHVCHYSLI